MVAWLRAARRSAALALWTLLVLPLGVPVLAARPLGRAGSLRLAGRIVRLWGRGILWLCGARCRTEGPLPPRGSFVACTHHGYADIVVLASLYPTTFVAKSEIARWPLLGPLARLAGTLWVDRARRADTARLREALAHLLRRGLSITVFPEGSAGRGDAVRPFRSPLFAAPAALQAPCVPASITYRTPGAGDGAAGPGEGSPHLTVCWWNAEPLPRHLWRLLSLPRLEATVRFRAPVAGIGDRKLLAAELQRRVAESFEPVPQ